MSGSRVSIRRNFITGSLAALAGAVGFAVSHRPEMTLRAASHDAPLTFYGRRRQRVASHPGMRTSHTVLYTSEGGAQVGDAQSTYLYGASPSAPSRPAGDDADAVPSALANAGTLMAFHSVNLTDGTLIGIGGTGSSGGASWAIVGGTGKYAGATGVCVETPVPSGRDDVELSITLNA